MPFFLGFEYDYANTKQKKASTQKSSQSITKTFGKNPDSLGELSEVKARQNIVPEGKAKGSLVGKDLA